ncbi:MAG: NUDIX hydrolase [Anaerolineae bacterium]|nr:MAG: NUDIX hydrolase [Anaerolineae bacterium]
MEREYPLAPLVGVAGVVIQDGCVLMIQRGREPGRGRWSIPGGRLHLGERLCDGVKREILEECGVRVRAGKVLGVADLIQRDDDGRVRYHYVLVDLAAEYLSGDPQPSSDALAARWVPFDELPVLEMPDRLRSLLDRVRTEQV